MKNIVVIFVVGLLFCGNIYSSDSLLIGHIDYIRQIVPDIINSKTINQVVKIDNSKIYIINNETKRKYYSENDTLILYVNMMNSKEKKKLTCVLPQDIVIFDFDVYNNKIVFLGQNTLLFYDFEKDNLIFDYKHSFDGNASHIKITDSVAVFYDSYISHGDGRTMIHKYNYLNRTEVYNYTFPNPEGYELSFIAPRRLIDYCDGQILLSDLSNYNLRIFDENKNLVTKFSVTPDKWKQPDNLDSSLMIVKNDPSLIHEYLGDFSSLERNNSTIQLVDFIDNKTIMVCWSSFDDNQDRQFQYYDFWKKKDGRWHLTKSDLTDRSFNHLMEQQFSLKLHFYFSYSYQISDSYILLKDNFPFRLSDIVKQNMTVEEVYNMKEAYYIDNPIKSSYYLFKYMGKYK